MRLWDLHAPEGARKRRKRVGRGPSSGHGKTSGRGHKGQKARSGGNIRPGFQGGQTPLTQQLPQKRGFVNIFRQEYAEVNVGRLSEAFSAGDEVNPEVLKARGIVKRDLPVKILGDGELDKPLYVRAHKFSASAKAKIEAAGGTAEVLAG
jgi:large subunit ribosomal protein L15